MAKVVTVELEAKTDKAISEIEELKKEIKKLNEEIVKGNKDTADSLKKVEKSSSLTAKGIRGIGNALKAAGLGIAIAAFAKLTELFNQNQKVADIFNKSFEVLSITFNDFFNFLDNNVGKVVGYFKSIFDDPVQSLKNFGQAIKDNIIERFNSALDTLGFLSSAIKKVFEGDFKGAMEDAKLAGREYVDVLTGVDGSLDKITEGVTNAANATSNYIKETIKSASENVNLAKSAEIAAVVNQGLIEKYDRQAEQLRQVRDEERNTIDERIEANNKLKATLDEQEKAMLTQVDLQIKAAQVEFDKNQSQENTIRLLEAQNEKEAVLAQIEGFRSEQKMNDLALDREKLDLIKSVQESESELSLSRKQFDAEQETNEVVRLTRLREINEEEKIIEEERLQGQIDLYQKGTQARADAEAELNTFLLENKQEQIEIEEELKEAKINQVNEGLDAVINAAGSESKIGRALFIAKTAIRVKEQIAEAKATLSRITLRASEAGVDLAKGSSATAKVGFPQNIPLLIAFAGQAAGIISAVKSAVSATKSQASSMGASGGGGGTIAAPQPAQFNVVGASQTSQLAQTISDQEQTPIKAFVVSEEVTTAQQMDRNIIEGASLG